MRTITVSEVMTSRVVSVRDDASVSNIDWEMTLAEVRHIPVIDERGGVVGIVSDRDLLRANSRADRDRLPVATIMTLLPYTVRADSPVRDAVEQMLIRKINALPVVDADDRLVGILTATDVLELTHRALCGLPIDAPRAIA